MVKLFDLKVSSIQWTFLFMGIIFIFLFLIVTLETFLRIVLGVIS
jgi:hypothetical protein